MIPLLLALLLLGGCTQPTIEKGAAFLDWSMSHPGIDPYLAYVYPGEDLVCPLENCNMTYRSLDRDFNLHFLGQLGAKGLLADDISRADQLLFAVAKDWEGKGIYNVQSNFVEGGIALDTYCIVGLIANDSAMAQVVAHARTGTHWLSEHVYTGDERFRRLADESWCIRLLSATAVEKEMLPQFVDSMMNETEALLASSSPQLEKTTGMIHTIYTLSDVLPDNPVVYGPKLRFYQDYAYRSMPSVLNDTLTVANVLDALLYSGYPRESLKPYKELLERRQEKDGFWYPSIQDDQRVAHVFTTFRVVGVLARFQRP
ncbi:MAG: hypothetical protein V1735_02505 [Nanoarchaeota archaeon]